MMEGPFGPEAARDGISNQNVQTIEAHLVVNFEATSSSSFQDNTKISK